MKSTPLMLAYRKEQGEPAKKYWSFIKWIKGVYALGYKYKGGTPGVYGDRFVFDEGKLRKMKEDETFNTIGGMFIVPETSQNLEEEPPAIQVESV